MNFTVHTSNAIYMYAYCSSNCKSKKGSQYKLKHICTQQDIFGLTVCLLITNQLVMGKSVVGLKGA